MGPSLAGMCLLDTTDGALMMALYTSKVFSRDTVTILYYSIVLTSITVFVSAFIGIIQILSLVQHVAEPEGSFWDGVGAIGDHYEIIGGSICGVFLLVGLGSVFLYKPWRRRMDRRAALRAENSQLRKPAALVPPEAPRGPTYGTGDAGSSAQVAAKTTGSETVHACGADSARSELV